LSAAPRYRIMARARGRRAEKTVAPGTRGSGEERSPTIGATPGFVPRMTGDEMTPRFVSRAGTKLACRCKRDRRAAEY